LQVENGEPITGGALGNANIAPRQLGENIFYLKQRFDNDLVIKANKADVYTKTEADGKYAQKATTIYGYGITDAYTQIQIDNQFLEIDSKFGNLNTLKTTDKTQLVKAINELHDTTKGVVAFYKNIEAGGNALAATMVTDGDKTQAQINANQKEINDNYLSKLSNELYVDDYIAKTATIRDAFIAALTDLKNNGGGTLNLGKGKSYLIFTSTSGVSTNILDFDQLRNVTINFNGSEIVVDTRNAQAVPRIFNLKNPKNITFNDVRVRDVAEKAISGTSPPNNWGPEILRITTDDTVPTKDKGGVVINNINVFKLCLCLPFRTVVTINHDYRIA
jgi:hypothetical protein